MSRDPVDAVVARLEAGGFDPRQTGPDSWESRCPVHRGGRRNLSIARGDDGRALVHCHHSDSCSWRDIIGSLGMSEADLRPPDLAGPARAAPDGKAKPRTFPAAAEAAESMAARLGKPTVWLYMYKDADGSERMAVARFDGPDGKTYRPFRKVQGGWQAGDPPEKLILYRLDELATAERVFVCEGEKAVDLVRGLGLAATTSAHGAKSPGKTDWTPLAGREVVILPDNDAPGFDYATAVAGLLARLRPQPAVKVVPLAGHMATGAPMPEGGDVEEWLSVGVPDSWDAEQRAAELRRLADLAPAEVPPEATPEAGPDEDDDPPDAAPTPSPVEPFPLDVLPEPAARLVVEAAESIGCPPDFPGAAVLGIAAGTIGRSVSLFLKPGYHARSTLWIAQIGPPSDGKSPANQIVSEPVRAIDKALADEHALAVRRWRDEADRAAENGKKSKPPPPAPRPRRIDVDDATNEALDAILANNPRGLVQILDELASYVASMNQYKRGRGSDRQSALKRWSGAPTKKDRAGNEQGAPIRCPHPCLTVFGGLTPDMIGDLVDPGGRSDGFLDRFLLVWPDPAPVPEWSERGVCDEAAEDWRQIVDRLWTRPMREQDGRPVPDVATFAPEGKARWIEHFNAHAAEMNSAGFPPRLRGPWGKLREYAGRLTLVLACLWQAADPTADPERVPLVGPADVDRAWRLIGYFKSHARRVHFAMDAKHREAVASKIQRQADKVAIALGDTPDGMTKTQIGNDVLNKNANTEELDQIMALLAKQGRARSRTEATGGRKATRWFSGHTPYGVNGVNGVRGMSPADRTLSPFTPFTP